LHVRFHLTLGEQVLDNEIFESLEQARPVIGKFIENYNREWLIHRLHLTSPLDYREDYERRKKGAA